jgi:GalNAc-alpha-(1->4)-GalNAc-alpha-(1->3)-diNAcBac-PP-undecaprenol alpha-1,4-N-acetyl-D-galactosaminyltransferase
MKVIFLAGSLNQGGAEFQILALAKLFKDKGHEVEVFALTDYDFYMPFIQTNSIKYTCLRNNQSKLKRVFLTAEKFRKSKPDLIISFLKVVSQVAIVAKLISSSKAKLIVGERTSLIRPLHDHYYFNLLLLADYITVNSVSKLNYLKGKFPLLKKRIGFIPNIIDVDNFSPKIPIKDENGVLKLAFVGRISPEKNVLALVQATSSLIKSGHNISLDLFGDNKNKLYFKEVLAQIGNTSINKKVTFKGPLKDVREAYGNTDLICLISHYEGFSNVLAEALACGIPIVASDIEENRFLVEDGVNGFLVNPNDIEDIARGIKKFLNMSNIEREEIKKNNRKKALIIFDKEAIYKEFVKIVS